MLCDSLSAGMCSMLYNSLNARMCLMLCDSLSARVCSMLHDSLSARVCLLSGRCVSCYVTAWMLGLQGYVMLCGFPKLNYSLEVQLGSVSMAVVHPVATHAPYIIVIRAERYYRFSNKS